MQWVLLTGSFTFPGELVTSTQPQRLHYGVLRRNLCVPRVPVIRVREAHADHIGHTLVHRQSVHMAP